MSGKVLRTLVLSCFLVGAAVVANAELIYVVGSGNILISFNDGTPDQIASSVAITGLAAGEVIRGIDFRPASAQLYALSSANRLLTINVQTGVATQVSSTNLSPGLSGTNVGFDFNPVADRIRIVTDLRENIRANPDTGAVVASDTLLGYAAGDVNASMMPTVTAVAYTNSIAFSPGTTLYGIDSGLNTLVRQGSINGSPTSPNSGQLFTIGSLGGFDVSNDATFDISSSAAGTAYFTSRNASGGTDLFTIDLSTGAIQRRNTIAGTATVFGMAVAQDNVIFTIPVIGSATGQNNTSFRGDLTLTNSSNFATTAKIDFFEAGNTPKTAPTATVNLTLAAGEQRILADVIKTLFNRDPGTGGLRITTSRPVSVVGRIYNQTTTGTFGQFIRGAEESERRLNGVLAALKVGPAQGAGGFRTNVGFFNPGTATATVTLTARGVDGMTLGTATRDIVAGGQSQEPLGVLFPSLPFPLGGDVYVTYTSTQGVFVYASVIDNATGDAIYIPAFRNN